MIVESIMKQRVVTVEMDDSLETVQDIFRKVRFHHLLVVSREELVGVISDRDLFKAVSPFLGTFSETDRDLSTLQKRVHQIMTRKLITVSKGMSIRKAAQVLMEENVSCLPVVTEGRKIEGILTWKDILGAVLNK